MEKTPQLKIGHYVLGNTLGVGTFGKVKGKVFQILYISTSMQVLNGVSSASRGRQQCVRRAAGQEIFWLISWQLKG